MPEYLFPMPGPVLRRLLDYKAEHHGEFTEGEACADVMLALDRVARKQEKRLKPIRYWSKRWGWTRYRVESRLELLRGKAEEWRTFFRQNQTEVRQKTGTTDDSRPVVRQVQPEVRQYRTEPEELKLPQTRAREAPRRGGEARRSDGGPPRGPAPAKETESHEREITIERVRTVAAMIGLGEKDAEAFFWHYENEGWGRVRNLKAKLQKWKLDTHRYGSLEPDAGGTGPAGTALEGPGVPVRKADHPGSGGRRNGDARVPGGRAGTSSDRRSGYGFKQAADDVDRALFGDDRGGGGPGGRDR